MKMKSVEKGRQSFNRGIEIIEMLAKDGALSASEIGRRLGINQSSATRLLQSLQQADLVYKPSFQRFALDLGILRLAGTAMTGFPIIKSAANVCNEFHRKFKNGYSVATIDKERLLYLAHIYEAAEASMVYVENSDFPISQSSLGLSIAYNSGEEDFHRLLKKENCPEQRVDELWRHCRDSFERHACFYINDLGKNKTNAAQVFQYDHRVYAMAVFNLTKHIPVAEAKRHLENGIAKILESIVSKV